MSFGKSFWKTSKDNWRPGVKTSRAFEKLKPKEQTKSTEGKFNNQSIATTIFNNLLNKRKNVTNQLYKAVVKNKLYFEYEGLTKKVILYEYMDPKELFDQLKNGQVKYYDVLKRQEEFLKKLNEVKIGTKTDDQKEMTNNLDKFDHSREKVCNFFRNYTGMRFDCSYQAKQDETKQTGLKNINI